jgi:hypothetical protein
MSDSPSRSVFWGSIFLSLAMLVPAAAQDQNLDAFIGRLQASLAAKDLPAYLKAFIPELHQQETLFFQELFDQFKMDNVSLRRAGSRGPVNSDAPFYIQAFMENSYSALQETWQVSLAASPGQWLIKEKKYAGDITGLYKIAIPGGRVERAAKVEINHQDIRLTFTDALVFYDNLPDFKTALIILGRGRLNYTPSLSSEQHQLELSYGRTELNEGLEYAYLRFSPSFFKDNIRIEQAAGDRPQPVSPADNKRAYSIFAKNYPRSFTVENSLNGGIYSTLPQSDEAVFEFLTASGRELAYINSPFAQESIHLIDRTQDRLVTLYSPPEEPGQKRMLVTLGPRFDVLNYSLDVDFTPQTRYLSAKARMDILAKTDHLQSLKLSLNPALEIVHLYDGDGRELFYTQDRIRQLLYIHLVDPVSRGSTFNLEVYYRGRIEPPAATLDVLSLPQERSYALVPFVYDSYFYTHSARWYPVPLDEDYFTARMRFIIPPEYACVSNGLLLSQTRFNDIERVEAIEKAGRSVFSYEIRNPVKYLSFLVGRLVKENDASSGLPGSLFLTPSVYVRPRGVWGMCRDILAFYQDLLGAFPFEKLDIVQRLWPTGGGNSPASFVILNEIPRSPNSHVVLDPNSPVDFSRYKEYFPAHEIAHQWWGQGVSWDTYHDQWLSEGLAQFSSILYLREEHGEKVFSGILNKLCQWTKKKSDWGAISLGSRLSYLNFEAFQAVIYDKSALVMFMLRDILGPETFRAGLRGFFQTCRYTAARTSQFQKAMEKASGLDLGLFFRGWFDSYDLPQARLIWSSEEKNGQHILRLSVEQAKDVFVFPLTLQWREGRQTVRRMIIVDKKNQVAEFVLKQKPGKLEVDPDRICPGSFDIVR